MIGLGCLLTFSFYFYNNGLHPLVFDQILMQWLKENKQNNKNFGLVFLMRYCFVVMLFQYLNFFVCFVTCLHETGKKMFYFFFGSSKAITRKGKREKAQSNKSPALRKSTNKGVWTVGTLNQLFIKGS